jgi:DNA-binding MarR family transcriptional regulator
MLAAALRIERSTASNLLRDMEDQGLVRRRKLRSDRRFVALELTERGHRLLLKAGNAGAGLVSRAASALTSAQILRLSLALRPILAAIRTDGSAAGGHPAHRRLPRP